MEYEKTKIHENPDEAVSVGDNLLVVAKAENRIAELEEVQLADRIDSQSDGGLSAEQRRAIEFEQDVRDYNLEQARAEERKAREAIMDELGVKPITSGSFGDRVLGLVGIRRR